MIGLGAVEVIPENNEKDFLKICEREAYKQAAIKLVNELFSFSVSFIVDEKDKLENDFNKHWDKFCDEEFKNFG